MRPQNNKKKNSVLNTSGSGNNNCEGHFIYFQCRYQGQIQIKYRWNKNNKIV